ncbi:lipoprotein [Clostridia bacterium]|nr:lipoprotein [Clostridia bacterium]
MKKTIALISAITMCFSFTACKDKEGVKLDPKNPITVTLWHYYQGEINSAFDTIVGNFNDSIGKEKGIIIESTQMGNTTDVENAARASANKEAGADAMPNMFFAYSDTAYTVDQLGLVADLNDYFSPTERSKFKQEFLDEGKINGDDKLKIIPVAKSTECFMLDDTNWNIFAKDTGVTYEMLATMDSIAEVSKKYYEWTDAKTPDVPYDGKAFFGRDSIANMFIVASKSFDVDLYGNVDGKPFLNVDETVMRKIWDYYYVPFISGYYAAVGKFRSDDLKVGDIVSYIGSISSASYFPKEITLADGSTYPIDCKVMDVPIFDGGKNVIVQQGAGVVVTKGTKEQEYASCEFLKYFTKDENNINFSGMSAYLPVKAAAFNYDTIKAQLEKSKIDLNPITDMVFKNLLNNNNKTFYTNKPFAGGIDARAVLTAFEKKCANDRAIVVSAVETGTLPQDAISELNTDENFKLWYNEFKTSLEEIVFENR